MQTYSIDELRDLDRAACGKLLKLGAADIGAKHGGFTLDNGIDVYLSKESEGENMGETVASYIVEFIPNDEVPESFTLDEIAVDGFYTDAQFDLAAHAAVHGVIIPAIEKLEV